MHGSFCSVPATLSATAQCSMARSHTAVQHIQCKAAHLCNCRLDGRLHEKANGVCSGARVVAAEGQETGVLSFSCESRM